MTPHDKTDDWIPAEEQVPRNLPDPSKLGVYAALAQVGMEMVAPVVLGVFLDSHFDWTPWATVGGAVFGLVGGMWHLVAILNRRNDSGSSPDSRNQT